MRVTSSLFPSFVGRLDDVGSNVGDGVVVQSASKCGHGILSVGHLGDDGLFGTSTTEVLVKGFLFQGLFGHDHVLSTSVASSAVGVEDLFSGTGISGEDRGRSNNGSSGTGGDTLGNLCWADEEEDTLD